VASYEVVRIDTLETDGFTAVEVLGSFEKGAYVFPLMACYAAMSGNSQTDFTEWKGTFSLNCEEVYNTNTLPLENEGYTPTLRASLPIFDYDLNEADGTEITLDQAGDSTNSGRGVFQSFDGVPYMSQSMQILLKRNRILQLYEGPW
jgi:hypothetical protein